MCGFAGELATRRPPDREAVERMAATMGRRGPDGAARGRVDAWRWRTGA
jgi:asparagine synthetase B (glutamine-hydrolysing)